MFEGVLIAESIRPGATLGGLRLEVRKITRHSPADTTAEQPATWTNIDFQADEAQGEVLAAALAEVLDERGWYADFRSDAETFVVFPGKIFRYPRGDAAERDKAQAYGRMLGVPEGQLDWPV
jgi:hypothetical protein